MAGKGGGGKPAPVSDIVAGLLDPMLRKKAGISIGLVQSWEEIAGPRLARVSRPEKIAWPRRRDEGDPFEPATLVVACEGAAALRLQHETGELIGRVNAFLGFAAIGRIRIVQKPVADHAPRPRRLPEATPEARARVSSTVGGIEDQGLREALERLGRNVAAARAKIANS